MYMLHAGHHCVLEPDCVYLLKTEIYCFPSDFGARADNLSAAPHMLHAGCMLQHCGRERDTAAAVSAVCVQLRDSIVYLLKLLCTDQGRFAIFVRLVAICASVTRPIEVICVRIYMPRHGHEQRDMRNTMHAD
jgi:hypothetical protein